jgi:hypothetical protein
MFGTLVVSLPSPHEGGDVVTKHCGKSKTFQTSESSLCYLWWFSDVSHEVLPVTSGYRFVLTYNLAVNPARVTQRPSASMARTENKPLRHALRRWLSQPEEDREASYLYYGLDHEYTEANVSQRGLKTRDRTVVDALHQLSATMPFYVFLAVLEKSEMGSCAYEDNSYGYRRRRDYYMTYPDDAPPAKGYHELQDLIERSQTIKSLVQLTGAELAADMPFDCDYVLQDDDDFYPAKPNEEDYQGFMGNSVRFLPRRQCIVFGF